MTKHKRKSVGRPTHEPNYATRAVVQAMARYGIAQEFIACELGIAKNTLKKHYKDILSLFPESDKDEAVKQSLFYNAVVKKNVKAQMFWLERRCQKEWGLLRADTTDEQKKLEVLKNLFNSMPD